MISGYVVIGITFTWARGTSGVRAVSPTRTIFTDDYLEARKAARSLSEYFETLGKDYAVNIYENCEKQRRERT